MRIKLLKEISCRDTDKSELIYIKLYKLLIKIFSKNQEIAVAVAVITLPFVPIAFDGIRSLKSIINVSKVS